MAAQRQTIDQPLEYTKKGLKSAAAWTVEAVSRMSALFQVINEGVDIGMPYVDVDGSVPSNTLLCSGINVQPWQGMNEGMSTSVYLVVARYEDVTGSANQNTDIEVDGPAVWTTESSLSTIPTDIDRLGSAVVNTARVPIEGETVPEPTEFQTAEWIRSNQNYFDAARWCRKFRARTNSTDWKGAGRREVLSHGPIVQALDKKAFSGGGLVKFTGRFEFKRSRIIPGTLVSWNESANAFVQLNSAEVPGFTAVRLSQGVQELNPDYDPVNLTQDVTKAQRYRPITMYDSDGRRHQVTTPVLLNQAGLFEHDDQVRKSIKVVYEIVEEFDLNALGI